MNPQTSVVLVHREPLMRDLLARSLSQIEGIRVAAVAGNMEELLRAVEAEKPDVALLGLYAEDDANGVTLGQRIRAQSPGARVVILADRADLVAARGILLGEGSGWSYLLKSSIPDAYSLGQAIKGAAAGMSVIDPAIIDSLRRGNGTPTKGLTDAQLRVLGQVAKGYTNDYIAQQLNISVRTVEYHMNEVYRTLRASAPSHMHPRLHAALTYLKGNAGNGRATVSVLQDAPGGNHANEPRPAEGDLR